MIRSFILGFLLLTSGMAMAITSSVELFEANYKYTTPQNVLESCYKDYNDIKVKFDDLVIKKRLDARFYTLSYKIDENEKRGKCLIIGSSPIAIKLEMKQTGKFRFDKDEAQKKCLKTEQEIIRRNPNTIHTITILNDPMLSRKSTCSIKYLKATI